MMMLLMMMTMPVMIFVSLMLRVMITLVMSMLMTVMMLILLMLMITLLIVMLMPAMMLFLLLMVITINVDGWNDVVIVDVDVDVELRNKSEFSLKCLLFPQAHLEVVGSQWVKQNSLKLFRNRSFMKLFFEVNGFSRIFRNFGEVFSKLSFKGKWGRSFLPGG